MGATFLIASVNPPGIPIECGLLGNASYGRKLGSSASASSGGGGWQVVDRALQRAATEWLDYYPLVMKLPLILDGTVFGNPGVSVESLIAVIESYEMPAPGTQPPRPPLLSIAGPVPHTELTWVCSSITWAGGEAGAIRNDAGQRIQQSFSMELTEYSPSTVTVTGLSPAEQAAAAQQAPA